METVNNQLTVELKNYAKQQGADLVGIASVSRYDGAPRMLKPQAHMPEAQSVICMAVHHPDASVEWGGEPNPNYPGPFQIGMIPKLDTISFRVSRFLEKRGYRTIPFSCTFYWRHRKYKDIPYDHAASFSHMTAFVAAGLGEYGRHGMVMSPKYGPRQRIVSVITAAELKPDSLYDGEPLCDSCGMCEKNCPGNNYKKEHLLTPEYIEFQIENKTFKYPNINRWRCFYGEQCHLDMNELAKQKEMSEEKIYEAMSSGIERIGGGYMCSSFKYCMAKPVRKWDRKISPGPLRKKERYAVAIHTVADTIEKLAEKAGADKIAIHNLCDFKELKGNFANGFRTAEFFRNFSRVITLSRSMPDLSDCGYLADRNQPVLRYVNAGRIMAGIMDVSRYIDDLGFPATMQPIDFGNRAAGIAGWHAGPNRMQFAMSIVCKIDLPLMNKNLAPWDGKFQNTVDASLPFLKHIDKIGVASMKNTDIPEIAGIKTACPDMKSLIVLAAGFPLRVVELAGKQEAEDCTAYAFVNYQTVRETLWAAHDLAEWLRAQGHKAIPVLDLTKDSWQTLGAGVGQYLPDIRANASFAAAAGLGEIGRNGMLLTPEFGPRQRFAFVLTSADLPKTAKYRGEKLCREGCRLCADACPVNALDQKRITVLHIDRDRKYKTFERQEARCAWARTLGMSAGEGPGLLGWKIPGLPVPDSLTEEDIKNVLAGKDSIQRICYNNPNHSDTVVERCLQACPAGN